MLIAGDIGGTKTDLAIYSTESGPLAPLAMSGRELWTRLCRVPTTSRTTECLWSRRNT
jgi:hypothetical protein